MDVEAILDLAIEIALRCLRDAERPPALPRKFGSDTVAAVLSREPDWNVLSGTAPENLRRLLRRCLEKDPKRRRHHVADARIEIDEILSGSPNTGTSARPTARVLRTIVGIAAVLLVTALSAYLLLHRRSNTGADNAPPDTAAQVTERRARIVYLKSNS